MLTAGRALGLVALLEAVDVGERGPSTPLWGPALAVWVVAAVLLLRTPSRTAWSLLAIGGAGLLVDAPIELRRQHLVLLVGLAVAAAVARDDGERRLLWRSQLTVLYAVAALAKLNESFLGGDVIGLALRDGPLGVLPPPAVLVGLGVALVVAEASLAVLLRVSPGWAVMLAAALHSTALVAATDLLVGLRLVVFGAAAVVACAAVVPARHDGRPATRP